MSNNAARSFLNDKDIALLESSEGAKNVVKKQQEISELEQKVIDTRVDLELLFRNSSENNKAICELRGIGFFGRLFKKKEIEAELAKLEGIKREFENDINATIEKIELIEKILNRLKTEFSKYAEELAKVGLTPEDIIAEYNLIKQEIAEAKNKQETPAPEVKPEPKAEQKPATAKRTVQTGRMSPLERFENRLKKTQEIQAKKSETLEVEQEKE